MCAFNRRRRCARASGAKSRPSHRPVGAALHRPSSSQSEVLSFVMENSNDWVTRPKLDNDQTKAGQISRHQDSRSANLNSGAEIPATVLGATGRGDWPTLPLRNSSLNCSVTARAALPAIHGSLAQEARCGQSPLPAAFGVAGISAPLFRLKRFHPAARLVARRPRRAPNFRYTLRCPASALVLPPWRRPRESVRGLPRVWH